MLELKNLQKTENVIEADFYPEDSQESGHISIRLDTGDITGYSAPKGYEKSISYIAHARQTLTKLAAQDSLPEKYTVKWY